MTLEEDYVNLRLELDQLKAREDDRVQGLVTCLRHDIEIKLTVGAIDPGDRTRVIRATLFVCGSSVPIGAQVRVTG